MSAFHEIWVEQCDAALSLRQRFGSQKALGYLVGEKLLAFVRAAEDDAAFATELPNFVARVRHIFTQDALRDYFDGVRRIGAHGHILDDESHALARAAGMFDEDIVRAAEDVLRMGRIRELLLDALDGPK